MDDNFKNLVNFISSFWNYKPDKITLDKSLDDLGMFGNDKTDFIYAFSKEFKIDITELKFEDYIEPEPSFLMYLDSLCQVIFRMKLTHKYDKKPITIRHLVEAIKIKKMK